MSRTLLISENFPPRHGGSGRWFAELYGRLPREQFVIVAGSADGDRDTDRDLSERLQVLRLPLSSHSWGIRSVEGLGFYLRSFRALSRIVRTHGITRVHCGRCLPEGVLGWLLHRRFGLPFVCYVHGEDVQTARESREHTWIINRVMSQASRIIANSENTAALLRDHWQLPDEKVDVLLPGMDASRFVPAERDARFLDRMGWTDRTVILTVGRLQRRKGQDMLIQALPLVIAQYPDVLYVIIGEGEERQRLQSLVHELGLDAHVTFLGEVDDDTVIRCYQQCTLFALPNRTEGSDFEGFGMVLAEAQACGKPVLAGDSGGTRETMIVGDTGLIVDCTSPTPLTAVLLKLLDDKERLAAMGVRGREHVSASLDWPAHVAAAKEVFEGNDINVRDSG